MTLRSAIMYPFQCQIPVYMRIKSVPLPLPKSITHQKWDEDHIWLAVVLKKSLGTNSEYPEKSR